MKFCAVVMGFNSYQVLKILKDDCQLRVGNAQGAPTITFNRKDYGDIKFFLTFMFDLNLSEFIEDESSGSGSY